MRLIVGLGNPGKKYEKVRHNTGFIALDSYFKCGPKKFELNRDFGALMMKDGDIIYAKPQNFMNNSGEVVSEIVKFYKIPLENVLVVHDDVDLAFGTVKRQKNISSAGHLGVESIIEALGTQDFWRLRIGIGRPRDNSFDVDKWVLENFSDEEIETIKDVSVEALNSLLTLK